jgi:hypothetical protein
MKYIYLGLGAVVVAGAVLGSVFLKKTDNQSVGTSNTKQEQNQVQVDNPVKETINPSGTYSVNELFSMNKPLKCSWKESATVDKDVTNIMYISGKKFYQDVTMGDLGHAFTVSDGDYLYIWNDFSGVASKMKITETETGIKSGKGTVGMDQKKDFICENWSVDNSVFSLPQGKNFKDVTEEMNQAFQGMDEGNLDKIKQQACDACQNAPTQELKTQCLENAECSQ